MKQNNVWSLRAQNAIEFAIILSVVMTFFGLIFAVAVNNYSGLVDTREDAYLSSVATTVSSRILQAMSSLDGFSTTYDLPYADFTIKVVGGSDIIVSNGKRSIIRFLPGSYDILGNICEGKNQILKSTEYGVGLCCNDCGGNFPGIIKTTTECQEQNASVWRNCFIFGNGTIMQGMRTECPLSTEYANMSINKSGTIIQNIQNITGWISGFGGRSWMYTNVSPIILEGYSNYDIKTFCVGPYGVLEQNYSWTVTDGIQVMSSVLDKVGLRIIFSNTNLSDIEVAWVSVDGGPAQYLNKVVAPNTTFEYFSFFPYAKNTSSYSYSIQIAVVDPITRAVVTLASNQLIASGVSTLTSTNKDAELLTNIVAYYRLNPDLEILNNTLTDSSNNSRDVVCTVCAKNNAVLQQFEFTNDSYLSFKDSDLRNDAAFSVMAWVRPLACHDTASYGIVDVTSSSSSINGKSANIILTNNKPGINTGPTYATTSSSAVLLGVWSHIAIIKENATAAKVYINGVLVSSTGSFLTLNLTNGPITIGSSVRVLNSYYGGLSDVAIFNKTLSSNDVSFYYQQGRSTGLVANQSKGYLDETFASVNANILGSVKGIAKLASGKYLAFGEFGVQRSDGLTQRSLVRLHANLSIDETFRTDGFLLSTGTFGQILNVSETASGQLYVLGTFSTVGGVSVGAVVRLTSNGALDTNFSSQNFTQNISTNTSGVWIDNVFTVTPTKMIVLNDSSVMVFGNFVKYGTTTAKGMVRLDTTGAIHSSFTALGFYTSSPYQISGYVPSFAFLVDTDKLFISSYSGDFYYGSSRFYSALVSTNGSIISYAYNFTNSSGGLRGVYTVNVVDGKLLISDPYLYGYNGFGTSQFIRILFNGSLDTTFVGQNFSLNGANSYIYTAYPLSGGKMLVNGYFNEYNGTNIGNNAAVLENNGSLTTFRSALLDTDFIYSAVDYPVGKYLITRYIDFNYSYEIVVLNTTGEDDVLFKPRVVSANAVPQIMPLDSYYALYGDFTSYDSKNIRGIGVINQSGEIALSYSSSGGFLSKLLDTMNIHSIASTNKGEIYVGGSFDSYDSISASALVKLTNNGTLDSGFIFNVTSVDPAVFALTILPSGNILVNGYIDSYEGVLVNRTFIIYPNGSLDRSFSAGLGFQTNTSLTTSPGYITSARQVLVEDDGKLVIVGRFSRYNGTTYAGIIRLMPDGTIDPSFNPGTGFDGSNYPGVIIADANNSYIVGGQFNTYAAYSSKNFVRILRDGTRDSTLSVGSGFNGVVVGLAVDCTNNIYVAGGFSTYQGSSSPYFIRVTASGAISKAYTGVSGVNGNIVDLQTDSFGNYFIAGGFSAFNNHGTNGVAKVTSDGNIDTTFSSFKDSSSDISVLDIEESGNLLVGGSFNVFNASVIRNGIFRFKNVKDSAPLFVPTPGLDITANALVVTNYTVYSNETLIGILNDFDESVIINSIRVGCFVYRPAVTLAMGASHSFYATGNYVQNVHGLSINYTRSAVTTVVETAATNFSCDPLYRDLLFFSQMDGNVYDLTTNQVPIVSNNATYAADRSNRASSALSFSGATQLVIANVSAVNPHNVITISMWIRPLSQSSNWMSVLFKGTENLKRQYTLWRNSGGYLHSSIWGSSAYAADSTANFNLNSWNFILVMLNYTSGRQDVYVNGVMTTSYGPGQTIEEGGPIYIGAPMDGWQAFNGQIDNLMIYNRTLSSDEVASLYNQAIVQPPTANVTYRYFRWNITKTKNIPSYDAVQVSEFELLLNGNKVSWPAPIATNPGGNGPLNQEAPKCVDGIVASKWLDWWFTNGYTPPAGKSVLEIDAGGLMIFNAYRYLTAEDEPTRIPVSWTLEGSLDGVTYTLLDTQSDIVVSNTPNVYTDTYTII